MTTIPATVQMFTLFKESQQDFAGTLKKVTELSFDGVACTFHHAWYSPFI